MKELTRLSDIKKLIKNHTKNNTINDIYNILSKIAVHEIGGKFHISNEEVLFDIDISFNGYNKEEDRPYTNFKVDNHHYFYWHSHPFSFGGKKYVNLSYPSIEDIDILRQLKDRVFLLLTEDAVYVFTLTKDTTLTRIIEFYKFVENSCVDKGWDYDSLLKNFINLTTTDEFMDYYGLFFYTIKIQDLNNKILYKVIKDAYNFKDSSFKKRSISKLLR